MFNAVNPNIRAHCHPLPCAQLIERGFMNFAVPRWWHRVLGQSGVEGEVLGAVILHCTGKQREADPGIAEIIHTCFYKWCFVSVLCWGHCEEGGHCRGGHSRAASSSPATGAALGQEHSRLMSDCCCLLHKVLFFPSSPQYLTL